LCQYDKAKNLNLNLMSIRHHSAAAAAAAVTSSSSTAARPHHYLSWLMQSIKVFLCSVEKENSMEQTSSCDFAMLFTYLLSYSKR